MGKFDLYVGRSVLLATLGVLLLLVGLDALTSIVDETDDMRDGYSFLDILIYVGYTLPRRVHEFVPFAALIGADTMPVRKPDPVPYREAVTRAGGTVAASFMVGDTETDLKTARNSGVRVALVSFGPEGPSLSQQKPDAMLDHFDALPNLARQWLSQPAI